MKFLLILFFCLFFIFPKPVFAQTKSISVDLSKQLLTAYQDNKIVYQTFISSGLPLSPSVKGIFHIYAKYPYFEMKGVSPYHGFYDLPNVPNVMYFYQGYSIHGAYWHNNFGHPMSNGCINANLTAAAWLYNFAPIGTTVTIY